MKPNRITEHLELLDDDGHLVRAGWATVPFWRYDRNRIKAPWYRIKEWDYYSVLDQSKGYGITFTFSDLGYVGLFAVCWLDFKSGRFRQYDTLKLLPRGRTNFPSSSDEGGVAFDDGKLRMQETVENGRRVISVDCPAFVGPDGERGLSGEITLQEPPGLESMAIATSWAENRRAFYYNHKINNMPATGEIKVGENRYAFDPDSSFGALDWGRGRWTFRNRWYWGSASGLHAGKPFGFNIGYGFSDRTPASENILYYDHRAHKLGELRFEMDTKDYTRPWSFTSDDGRFEMTMEPVVDRNGATNFLLIKSIQHQVFGYFSGEVVLDDGTRLKIDRLLGFAEDVLNWG